MVYRVHQINKTRASGFIRVTNKQKPANVDKDSSWPRF